MSPASNREREKSDATTASAPEDTTALPTAAASESNYGSASGDAVLLTEEECRSALGFGFSSRKKWTILVVIFLVQSSMNFNASVYGNAVPGLAAKYGVSQSLARMGGQLPFLVAYAFGCELWAPWSEELGRRWIMQGSLGLVNVWALMAALAPTMNAVIIARVLGGLSSAGGSVTLGMVADLWGPDEHHYAIAFVVLSSVMGSVFGPVAGGFLEQYLAVQWNFWVQLIFGFSVQLLHLFLVPETRSSILCTREARRRRANGDGNVRSALEINGRGLTPHRILITWLRPFHMFLTEPIVLLLSLLSGFSDALIFTFLESFGFVFGQWGFSPVQTGLAFIPIGIGYIIAYLIWLPFIAKDRIARKHNPDLKPESRLFYLLWTAPLLSTGLIAFAWSSLGPSHNSWALPMAWSCLIGIANFAIYGATIDYMVVAYREYSASASGGNGFARDFLAGISSLYARRLYMDLGHGSLKRFHLSFGSTLLAGLAVVMTVPIYVFYFYGPQIRARSKFAIKLAAEHSEREQRVEAGEAGES